MTPSAADEKPPWAAFVEQAIASLGKTEAIATAGKKRSFWSVGYCPPARLPDVQVDRAARLAEDVAKNGGAGSAFVMSMLLGFMLAGNDERLIPAWERMLISYSRFGRNDVTASMRASAAGMALRSLLLNGVEAARDPVFRFVQAAPPEHAGDHLVRTLLLLQALGRDEDARAFAEVAARSATEADSFKLRYLARLALLNAGLPVPFDHGDGFYTFLVTYEGFSCAIEVASDDSLTSLRGKILHALDWNTEHAWCYYLDGSAENATFWWPIEGMYEDPYPWREDQDTRSEEADDALGEEEDIVWDPDELRDLAGEGPLDLIVPECVGELGLRTGNKITLHCGGGDHRISVKVGRIGEKRVARARYPRVTAKKGKRPRQYPR